MKLGELIKEKLKQERVVLGFKAVMKFIKTGQPELVIIANNLPEEKRKMLEYNAKMSKVRVEKYPDDSFSLGLLCGKPFSVGVLAVKRGRK